MPILSASDLSGSAHWVIPFICMKMVYKTADSTGSVGAHLFTSYNTLNKGPFSTLRDREIIQNDLETSFILLEGMDHAPIYIIKYKYTLRLVADFLTIQFALSMH